MKVFYKQLIRSAGIFIVASCAQATLYTIEQNQTVVGELKFVLANHEDTFIEIAKEFELGYEELVAANPHVADPWLVKEGTKIHLPLRFILPQSRKKGIHINLAEYRLYYFAEDDAEEVWSYPISIGRGDWQTPTGDVTVLDKIINPSWYPPASIREEHALDGDPLPRVVPPGPDNPLGKYALQLSAAGYFIHGTNRPYGIGMRVTHGCIRLRPHDIEVLFKKIPRGDKVYITYEPFKFAEQDGLIYFESHPKLTASVEENARKWMTAMRDVLKLADDKQQLIDRVKLLKQVSSSEGMPQVINLDVIEKEVLVSEVARSSTKADSVFVGEAEDRIF